MAGKTETAPAELADRLEQTVKGAAKLMLETSRSLREAAGPRPFLGEEVGSDKALGRYAQIRHDVQGWTKVLRSVAKIKEDGRVLLPKELVKTIKEFETQLREGEI